MFSSPIFKFLNIVIMLVLIVVIALQNKSSGLSNVFGGGGNIVQTSKKWSGAATKSTFFARKSPNPNPSRKKIPHPFASVHRLANGPLCPPAQFQIPAISFFFGVHGCPGRAHDKIRFAALATRDFRRGRLPVQTPAERAGRDGSPTSSPDHGRPGYLAPRPFVEMLERYEISMPVRYGVDGVLAVSDALADYFVERGYPREKILPIYFGYAAKYFPFYVRMIAPNRPPLPIPPRRDRLPPPSGPRYPFRLRPRSGSPLPGPRRPAPEAPGRCSSPQRRKAHRRSCAWQLPWLPSRAPATIRRPARPAPRAAHCRPTRTAGRGPPTLGGSSAGPGAGAGRAPTPRPGRRWRRRTGGPRRRPRAARRRRPPRRPRRGGRAPARRSAGESYPRVRCCPWPAAAGQPVARRYRQSRLPSSSSTCASPSLATGPFPAAAGGGARIRPAMPPSSTGLKVRHRSSRRPASGDLPEQRWAALEEDVTVAAAGQILHRGGRRYRIPPDDDHIRMHGRGRTAVGRGRLRGEQDRAGSAGCPGHQRAVEVQVKLPGDDRYRRRGLLPFTAKLRPDLLLSDRTVLLRPRRTRPHQDHVGEAAQNSEHQPVGVAGQAGGTPVEAAGAVDALDHVGTQPRRVGRASGVGVELSQGLDVVRPDIGRGRVGREDLAHGKQSTRRPETGVRQCRETTGDPPQNGWQA